MNVLDFLPRCQLAEGVLWDHRHQLLLYVDILQCKLYMANVAAKSYKEVSFDENTCWVQMTSDPDLYLVGLKSKIVLLNRKTLQTQTLETILGNSTTDRLNDSFIDASGRVWFGTMNQIQPNQNTGLLYSFDSRNGLICHDHDYAITNGPVSVNDGHALIHNDSAKHRIYRYVLNNQHLSDRMILKDYSREDISPDGMTTDEKGHIWVALWNGWRIQCLDCSNGLTLLELMLPARYPTKPCFGGSQLNTLYVSTAVNAESDSTDDQGGYLFEFSNLSFHGQPAYSFDLE
jgi:xylono-1,5-lactonase